MNSFSTSSARSARVDAAARLPSSAATAPPQNVPPSTLAARRTRRASGSSDSSRACTIASTVSGSGEPSRSTAARTSSSRKNALPAPCATMRATVSSSARAPSAASTSPVLARFDSSRSSTCTRPRPLQSFGKRSRTFGRANASTIHGRSFTTRSAESRYATLSASPQCRSSSTTSSGRAPVSAVKKSSHAARSRSPIVTGSCKAASRSRRASSADGPTTSRVSMLATRRWSGGGTRRPTRAAIFARLTARGSPGATPVARRSSGAIMTKGAPAVIASPRPNHTSTPGCAASIARTSSWRRRDLPTPAAPVTSTAREIRSVTQSPKSSAIDATSRSRPTNGVGLPRSLRGASSALCSPNSSAQLPPLATCTTSKRGSMRPAVTSSSGIACERGPAAAARTMRSARSIASPNGSAPATSPRPVASAIGASGRSLRIASAQRAARDTRSVAEPPPASVATTDPSSSRSASAPKGATVARSTSSSPSVTIVAGPFACVATAA
ncbi:MAG TPA: hypothetical protein VGM56_23870 [Byssovorax sp.]